MSIENLIEEVASRLKEIEDFEMTDQLRMELEDRLEKAEATGDPARINEARRAIDHHTLECQAHTADRIKRIEKDVTDIKFTVEKISEAQEKIDGKHKQVANEVYATKDEIKEIKARAAGAKAGISGFLEVMKWVIAAGGGGLLLKFIQNINL